MRCLELQVTGGNSLMAAYGRQVAVDRTPKTTGTLDGRRQQVPRDSGIDLFAPCEVTCFPGRTTVIDLGVVVSAYEIRPTIQSNIRVPLATFLMARSSTGTKTPLRLANAVGLIDEGYRGCLKAAVDNISQREFVVEAGARYFQLVAADGKPFDKVRTVESLDATARGSGGFGSTGH
jgi:dUTP pyrophosphatase